MYCNNVPDYARKCQKRVYIPYYQNLLYYVRGAFKNKQQSVNIFLDIYF
jgi:hypothetical protein